jgi:prepilin-type N-terminal cleavage/methylation domain-containing protein
MSARTSRRGFTLLEIMVAVAILALMALMLSRIFSESTRAVERGKGQALLDETARLLLDQAQRDIAQALIRTNVAFRVHEIDGNDALYFISTAVRHQLETIPRDTAPMRWQATRVADWNRYVEIDAPKSIDETVYQSDYYVDPPGPVADFKTVHGGADLQIGHGQYTQPLTTGSAGSGSHALLTFMEFSINGDRTANRSADGLPEQGNLPRFVDITIGLIVSKDMEQAIRLRDGGNAQRADEYINRYERIYARRIYLPNQGLNQLSP